MKTIVLATDFSKNASPASDFAFQLVRLLNARLVLLNVYHHPLRVPLLREVFTPMEEKNKISARRKLYRLRNRLQKAGGGDISISVIARQGAVLETIEAVAKEEQADLLVMGTAGAGSPGVQLFGSQATAMIPRSPVSLLLVPPKAHFVPFKNIVLALDLEKSVDALVLDDAIRFATRFNACLNVVCVNNKPADSGVQQAAARIRDLLKQLPHTLSIVDGNDLTQVILQFAQENRADLIMMLPQPHNRILFSFLESNTQQLARQSNVPILALV